MGGEGRSEWRVATRRKRRVARKRGGRRAARGRGERRTVARRTRRVVRKRGERSATRRRGQRPMEVDSEREKRVAGGGGHVLLLCYLCDWLYICVEHSVNRIYKKTRMPTPSLPPSLYSPSPFFFSSPLLSLLFSSVGIASRTSI